MSDEYKNKLDQNKGTYNVHKVSKTQTKWKNTPIDEIIQSTASDQNLNEGTTFG